MIKLPLLSYPLVPLALPLFRTHGPDALPARHASEGRTARTPAGDPCPADGPDADSLTGALCLVREGGADRPAAAGVAGTPSLAC